MKSSNGWAEFWSQAEQNLARGWSWSGFERSVFYVNDGAADFVDVGTVLGTDQVSDGRGLAAGDIDGDGDLDLVGTCSGTHPHVYVLRNDVASDGHFLLLDLVPEERRSAAGARVLLTAGGRTQRRDVVLGSGFLSQHATTLSFGLAEAEEIERLEVTWPDGEVQERDVSGIDRHIVLRQDEGPERRIELAGRNYNATRRLPEVEWDSEPRSLLRAGQWAPNLSSLQLVDVEGNELPFGPATPERSSTSAGDAAPHVLLNLWASWCSNCKAEVDALNAAHADASSGLRVVGLNLDEESTDAELAQTVAEWGIEYPVSPLRGWRREHFEKATAAVFGGEGGLVLPSSLLLGPEGTVLALAQGEVDFESLGWFLESLRARGR